jgi:hypothetical protein
MQLPCEKASEEKLQATLTLVKNEQDAFMSHWVWKKIGCKPEAFFAAFKKHLASLNLPQKQWEEAVRRARDALQTHSKEKQAKPNSMSTPIPSGLKA